MKGKEGNPLAGWCFSFSSSVFLSCRSRRRKKAASQASSMNGIRSRRRPRSTGAAGRLPQETQELLEKLGITSLEPDGLSSLKPESVCSALLELTSQEASDPLRSIGVILGIVLLCALMEDEADHSRYRIHSCFQVVCLLAACAALLVPLSSCIQAVCRAAESTSIFMGSFVPVYAGILLTSGQAVTAASYQTVVLFAAELITLLATHVLVPVLAVSLALGLAGSLDTGLRLDSWGGN